MIIRQGDTRLPCVVDFYIASNTSIVRVSNFSYYNCTAQRHIKTINKKLVSEFFTFYFLFLLDNNVLEIFVLKQDVKNYLISVIFLLIILLLNSNLMMYIPEEKFTGCHSS